MWKPELPSLSKGETHLCARLSCRTHYHEMPPKSGAQPCRMHEGRTPAARNDGKPRGDTGMFCCKVAPGSARLRKQIGSESKAWYGPIAPQLSLSGAVLLLQSTATTGRTRDLTLVSALQKSCCSCVSREELCVVCRTFYFFPSSSSLLSVFIDLLA